MGMPVTFVPCSRFFIELLHELRAVVGKNRVKRLRKTLVTMRQFGGQRHGSGGPSKSKSRVVINQADDVTPDIIENHSTSQSDNRPNPLISYP